MKRLLGIIFLMVVMANVLPAQMSKYKSKSNVYRNSDIHRYGFKMSNEGKIGACYLGAIGTFTGTAIYANQTFPTAENTYRTSQQNAILITGTAVTGALVTYGTYRLWRKNHR